MYVFVCLHNIWYNLQNFLKEIEREEDFVRQMKSVPDPLERHKARVHTANRIESILHPPKKSPSSTSSSQRGRTVSPSNQSEFHNKPLSGVDPPPGGNMYKEEDEEKEENQEEWKG
jgi:hypothetical protein